MHFVHAGPSLVGGKCRASLERASKEGAKIFVNMVEYQAF